MRLTRRRVHRVPRGLPRATVRYSQFVIPVIFLLFLVGFGVFVYYDLQALPKEERAQVNYESRPGNISPTREAKGTGQVTSASPIVGEIQEDNVGWPSSGEVIRKLAFALEYSEEHEIPRWVQYELTPWEAAGRGAERESKFSEDPDIRTRSASHDDYTNSGYDRGHMAPAADFRWSRQAMAESFLTSNIVPQNPKLNRGLWANLEASGRTYAERHGRVFIVTGPILQSRSGVIGKENKVTVPRALFKVFMDPDRKKGVAFIVPNESISGSPARFAVPIREVERLTGLNFFNRLPDQDAFETTAESSWFLN